MSASRRRRRDPSSWREILARHRASGMSVQAFCASQELCVASFYRWRERLAGDHHCGEPVPTGPHTSSPSPQALTPGFVDVGSLLGSRSMNTECSGHTFELRLDLGGGVVLQLTRQ